MTFQPGQSGNPAGRAVGSRNKKTLAGPPAANDYARRVREMNEDEPAAEEAEEADDENRYRSSQDPERRFPGESVDAPAAASDDPPEALPVGDRLQIVADSHAGGRRAEAG